MRVILFKISKLSNFFTTMNLKKEKKKLLKILQTQEFKNINYHINLF